MNFWIDPSSAFLVTVDMPVRRVVFSQKKSVLAILQYVVEVVRYWTEREAYYVERKCDMVGVCDNILTLKTCDLSLLRCLWEGNVSRFTIEYGRCAMKSAVHLENGVRYLLVGLSKYPLCFDDCLKLVCSYRVHLLVATKLQMSA